MSGFSRFIMPAFEPQVRSRGAKIVNSGAVDIESGSAVQVQATVRGTSLYEVRISIEKDGVYTSCECPYYAEGLDPCKHVWATALAAESEGLLTGYSDNVDPVLILDDEMEIPLPAKWHRDQTESNGTPKPDARPALPAPRWQSVFAQLGTASASAALPAGGYGSPVAASWPAGRSISYRIDLPEMLDATTLSIEIVGVDIKADGETGKSKPVQVGGDHIPMIPDPVDRRILSTLIGGRTPIEQRYAGTSYGYGYYPPRDVGRSSFTLSYGPAVELLPDICATGRAYVQQRKWIEPQPVSWEPEQLELWIAVRADGEGGGWRVTPELRIGDRRIDPETIRLMLSGRLAIAGTAFAVVAPGTPLSWLYLLRSEPFPIATREEADHFLATLLVMPWIPKLDLPEELRFEEIVGTPRPRLMVRQGKTRRSGGTIPLAADLSFLYGEEQVGWNDRRESVYLPETRSLAQRDRKQEGDAFARLVDLGLKRRVENVTGIVTFELAMKKLPSVARTLLAEGWLVEAEGKLYRQSTGISLSVKSNVDWFDLEGGATFEGMTVALPRLLAALRKGEETVALDDGTFGILPETWIARYARLARAGSDQDDHIRFARAQVGLLDALLAEQPEVGFDEGFEHARRQLLEFEGIEPVDPPAGFVGTLREYQREALGWMLFLQRFGFGGCLADDMGLGKTPMALALLAMRKEKRDETLAASLRKDGKPRARPAVPVIPPSLVVVPKTLVFNWVAEIEQFLPTLRVVVHTGLGRSKDGADFDDADLVITTYGTLRRDAVLFKDRVFDYLILDEAQAIKNASTESAKAARLLRGSHRLALSGTPIENHLGELWSLFEFLNPGMLGSSGALGLATSGSRGPDEETRKILARALRPFILRRTKAQVAKDLPEKTEQTIWCELEPEQRKMYDELRTHYRGTLLGRLDRQGLAKSKIQILEALLRLRQAACHPGLVDRKRLKGPSAKLDTLMEKIHEVIESGGKALVFSQFTSLLAIVRKALDVEKIDYEYLDGKTRDRQQAVRNFQSESGPSLFLISLKAGGVGLNLTAAEYVFLLDPWWNPAVEAQAIDRTHRIGQTRAVFAYRIVAADTVEEKILELQKTKRDLADAIVGAENSLIRQMTRDDLELLLS